MKDQLLPFVDGLLKEKNLSGMNENVFIALRSELSNELEAQINNAIIDALDDSSAEKLESVINSQGVSEHNVQSVIAESGVDTTKIIASTMAAFREFYLGNKESAA